MNKSLSITLVIVVLLLYIQYYSKYNYDYTIVQGYLDTITTAHLLEKSPIVVYDQIVDPRALLKTLFRYSYIHSKTYMINDPNHAYMNSSKYIILYSPNHAITIDLINPKYNTKLSLKKNNVGIASQKGFAELEDVTYITIKLKPNQVLILPSLWCFRSDKIINVISLQDIFSAIYFSILCILFY
jgi:hypothetical protein